MNDATKRILDEAVGKKFEKLASPRYDADEVTFVALPPVHAIERPGVTSIKVDRYRSALWAVAKAQRDAAVIAAEILRPGDMAGPRHELREKMHHARREYREQALRVFSEKCTKGM